MSELGTPDAPLRVAIIGSGPSGFYAAERLLSRPDLHVQVEMFDRLPTPFGLVRGGVAPDHQKIKSVTKVYDRIASHPEFRFYGNVEIGRAVARDDLLAYVHAVIYAVGAATDRRMGIPGEHLPGSHSATDFVGWYNGHPDYRCLSFDLSAERALVVGNGNVAMDVARILASTTTELTATDIADHALTALAGSGVREIILLGRRGPAQAAFTPKELKELGELEDVDVIADPQEVGLDELSQAAVDAAPDRNRDENIKVMAHYAERSPVGKHRRVVLRFLASPVELIGTDRVEAVRIVHNQLAPAADGSLRPRATDRTEDLPVGLVFRAIGYQGTPIPGLPFDDWNAVIPNRAGRIMDGETQVPREYVVGWIKRGPQGIIGTNKPDSHETVDALLEDLAAWTLPATPVGSRAVIERLVAERAEVVSYQDWLALDAAEKQRGEDAGGRPRVKFTRVDQMLEALGR